MRSNAINKHAKISTFSDFQPRLDRTHGGTVDPGNNLIIKFKIYLKYQQKQV